MKLWQQTLVFAVCVLLGNYCLPVLAQTSLNLGYFEPKIVFGSAMRLADSKIQQRASELDITQVQSGLKIYGGVTVENPHETDSDDLLGGALSGEIGLQVPLFGNKAEEDIDNITAEYSVDIAYLKRETRLRASLRALRENYILYWESIQKLNLSRAYLEDQQKIGQLLDKRSEQHLLLDADRYEFMSTFGKAKMDLSMFSQHGHQALDQINILTSGDQVAFFPNQPDLNTACTSIDLLEISMRNTHPELRLLDLESKKYLDSDKHSRWLPIKSSAYAGLRFRDDSRRFDGDRWGAGINFTMPANVKKAMRVHQNTNRVQANTALLTLAERKRQLHGNLQTAFNQFRTATYGLQFAMQRVTTAREGLKKDLLRYNSLDGDVLEKLQVSRYHYYRVAVAAFEAQGKYYKAQVHLLEFLPEGCDSAFNMGLNGASIEANNSLVKALTSSKVANQRLREFGSQENNALYIWNAELFFKHVLFEQNFLNSLKKQGFTRLLVSLNRHQIDEVLYGNTDLIDVVEQAHQLGIFVELLLGEPTWMQMPGRKKLLTIIDNLRDIPFDGLHLDLEPEQLSIYQQYPNRALKSLIDTLNEVQLVSPWPLSISVHYRNLGEQTVCLACALRKIQPNYVNLMIYVANPNRVAQIARPILQNNPTLNMSIALSVEPFLNTEETLWGSKAMLEDKLKNIKAKVSAPNLSHFSIQSWEYLSKMQQ